MGLLQVIAELREVAVGVLQVVPRRKARALFASGAATAEMSDVVPATISAMVAPKAEVLVQDAAPSALSAVSAVLEVVAVSEALAVAAAA